MQVLFIFSKFFLFVVVVVVVVVFVVVVVVVMVFVFFPRLYQQFSELLHV